MIRMFIKTKRITAIAITITFVLTSFAIVKINSGNADKIIQEKSEKEPMTVSQINNSSHDKVLEVPGNPQKEFTKEAKEKLISEGYTEKEITEVSMLVERVMFQLNEIVGTEQNIAPAQMIMDEKQKKLQEENEMYKTLAEKIDVKKAIQLSLHLSKEFESYSAVMDEYLLCLQIDLDLEDYIKDKEAYEKEKTEKSMGHDMLQIITLAKIEEKLLEKLQNKNPDEIKKENTTPRSDPETLNKNMLPEEVKPNIPEMAKTNAPNPVADINKELDDIKSKSMGQAFDRQ